MLLAAIPPTKEELSSFTVWQINQLNKLGVVVHLNTELTLEMLSKKQPDSIIVATGASPFVPPVPGHDLAHVLNANDILEGKVQAGKRVVVIGGGLVGSETAAHLANHGHTVSIVEMNSDIFVGTPSATKHYLLKDLQRHNVAILTNTQVKEISTGTVLIEREGTIETLASVDSVVMAIGSRPVSFPQQELEA